MARDILNKYPLRHTHHSAGGQHRGAWRAGEVSSVLSTEEQGGLGLSSLLSAEEQAGLGSCPHSSRQRSRASWGAVLSPHHRGAGRAGELSSLLSTEEQGGLGSCPHSPAQRSRANWGAVLIPQHGGAERLGAVLTPQPSEPSVRNFDCGASHFPPGRLAVTNATYFQAFS